MQTTTIAAIRFGTGLSPEQPAPADAATLLESLAGADTAAARFPIAPLAALVPAKRRYRAATRARRRGRDGAEAEYKAARKALRTIELAGLRQELLRAVTSPAGLRERLQVFWADHFTVRAKGTMRRADPSAFAEDAIRPHLTGTFGEMLRAAVTHPVMLAYLDQNSSIGPTSPVAQREGGGLNENLGREVLELHTLGVDAGYSQTDVRQFALLLTGLGSNLGKGFVFHPAWAEPGAEQVLGRSYGGDGRATLDDIEAALDDLALHPATARHIARKLAVHFVSDTPDPGLVEHVAAAYSASRGSLPSVYTALLEHPAAWAPLGAKARQPWDFIVAGLRALGIPEAALAGLTDKQLTRAIVRPLRLMGQPWQKPLGPDGWAEEAEAWITPPALAERIRWAMQVTELSGTALPDPRALLATALADAATPTLTRAVAQAESRSAGAGLVLASPDFNRR